MQGEGQSVAEGWPLLVLLLQLARGQHGQAMQQPEPPPSSVLLSLFSA
jgi:hypothetical protein